MSSGPAPSLSERLLQPFRRNKKRSVVLLTLLPVMVLAWIPVIRGNANAAPSRQQVAPALDAEAFAPAPTGEVFIPTMLDDSAIERHLADLRVPPDYRWELSPATDPFVRDSGSAAAVGSAVASDASKRFAHLVPSLIVLAGEREPIAMIAGRACRIGDEVDGFVIAAIEARRVVVLRANEPFTISIPEPEVGKTP